MRHFNIKYICQFLIGQFETRDHVTNKSMLSYFVTYDNNFPLFFETRKIINILLFIKPEDQRSCKLSPEICYINQIFILKNALYGALPTNQNGRYTMGLIGKTMGLKNKIRWGYKNINGANLPILFHRSMELILQVSLYFLADKNTKHI